MSSIATPDPDQPERPDQPDQPDQPDRAGQPASGANADDLGQHASGPARHDTPWTTDLIDEIEGIFKSTDPNTDSNTEPTSTTGSGADEVGQPTDQPGSQPGNQAGSERAADERGWGARLATWTGLAGLAEVGRRARAALHSAPAPTRTGRRHRGFRPATRMVATPSSTRSSASATMPATQPSRLEQAGQDMERRAAQMRAAAKDGGPVGLLIVFYVVMAGIALYGQSQGLVRWLGLHTIHLPVPGWDVPARLPALGAAAAIELLAAVLFAVADWRRRRGESALAARALSVAVAVGVAVLNWAGHPGQSETGQRLLFTGTSVAAFAIWVLHAGARRRDAAGGQPAGYGPWQWLTAPRLTAEARRLRARDTEMGVYDSLDEAAWRRAREARRQELTTAIRARIVKDIDAADAAVAVASYDVDAIAAAIASRADNVGMARLLAADLTPGKLTGHQPAPRTGRPSAGDAASASTDTATRTGRRAEGGKRPGRREPDVSDLIAPGRHAARVIADRGDRLTKKSLADQLRADGHTASVKRVLALLHLLKSTPDTPDPDPNTNPHTSETDGEAA